MCVPGIWIDFPEFIVTNTRVSRIILSDTLAKNSTPAFDKYRNSHCLLYIVYYKMYISM